jgi:hypothetical protein
MLCVYLWIAPCFIRTMLCMYLWIAPCVIRTCGAACMCGCYALNGVRLLTLPDWSVDQVRAAHVLAHATQSTPTVAQARVGVTCVIVGLATALWPTSRAGGGSGAGPPSTPASGAAPTPAAHAGGGAVGAGGGGGRAARRRKRGGR